MTKKENILVIAAHPDDEILGCGGTIAKLASEGHNVEILIMAEGITSRDLKRDTESRVKELNELKLIASKAGQIVGATEIKLLDFPDNRMDSLDRLDIIKVVEAHLERFKPNKIFCHYGNDLNIDHRIVNEAVVTASRPYPNQSVKELLFYEVPSSTEWSISSASDSFRPNYFVSLHENDFNKKISALKIYRSEMREFPHSRSIIAVEALGKWRGASVGVNCAEAFMVGRIVS